MKKVMPLNELIIYLNTDELVYLKIQYHVDIFFELISSSNIVVPILIRDRGFDFLTLFKRLFKSWWF